MAGWARTLLARTAGLNWVVSVVLVVFHVADRRDPDGTVIALWLVLAMSGTVIASVRRDKPEGPDIDQVVDKLVDAFIASRPGGECAAPLRLVDPPETGLTIPVPRRSVL